MSRILKPRYWTFIGTDLLSVIVDRRLQQTDVAVTTAMSLVTDVAIRGWIESHGSTADDARFMRELARSLNAYAGEVEARNEAEPVTDADWEFTMQLFPLSVPCATDEGEAPRQNRIGLLMPVQMNSERLRRREYFPIAVEVMDEATDEQITSIRLLIRPMTSKEMFGLWMHGLRRWVRHAALSILGTPRTGKA